MAERRYATELSSYVATTNVRNRLAQKLKRRQWDPPKKNRRVSSPEAERSEEEAAAEGIQVDLRVENLLAFEKQINVRVLELELEMNGGAVLDVASELDVALAPSLNSDEELAIQALAEMAAPAPGPSEDNSASRLGKGQGLSSRYVFTFRLSWLVQQKHLFV